MLNVVFLPVSGVSLAADCPDENGHFAFTPYSAKTKKRCKRFSGKPKKEKKKEKRTSWNLISSGRQRDNDVISTLQDGFDIYLVRADFSVGRGRQVEERRHVKLGKLSRVGLSRSRRSMRSSK
jgi:hypothetical protein